MLDEGMEKLINEMGNALLHHSNYSESSGLTEYNQPWSMRGNSLSKPIYKNNLGFSPEDLRSEFLIEGT